MRVKLILLSMGLAALIGCGTLRGRGGKTNPVGQLNNEALADYEAGRARIARDKLMRALALAHEGGSDKTTDGARTWLYLGVVHAGGLKQPGKAVDQMARALVLDSSLRVPDRLLKDARVKKAFARAEIRAKRTLAANALKAVDPVEEKPAIADRPGKPGKRGGRVAVRSGKGKPQVSAKSPAVGKTSATATAPPAAVAAVAAPEEADIPQPLPETIFCPLPDEVPPGQALAIWCAVDPSIHAGTIVVNVRPSGQTEFTSFPATRTRKGWYAATVDAPTVRGTLLQYYVEARGGGDKSLAATGTAESPELLLLRAGAAPVEPLLTVARLDALDDGDAPAADAPDGGKAGAVTNSPPAPEVAEDPLARTLAPPSASVAGGPRLWVGLQGGTGFGWHGASDLELRSDLSVPSGSAPASLLQLLPEIGYRLNDRITLGLQTRHQFITHEGTPNPGTSPAAGAHSILLRGAYQWFERSAFAAAATASLGIGEGFRLVHGPDTTVGNRATDTVRGGPFLFGPGILGTYRIMGPWTAAAEMRLLFGVPDFGVLTEFSAGLRHDL